MAIHTLWVDFENSVQKRLMFSWALSNWLNLNWPPSSMPCTELESNFLNFIQLWPDFECALFQREDAPESSWATGTQRGPRRQHQGRAKAQSGNSKNILTHIDIFDALIVYLPFYPSNDLSSLESKNYCRAHPLLLVMQQNMSNKMPQTIWHPFSSRPI